MSTLIHDRIRVGDQSDCVIGLCMTPGDSVIHCVKDPCHKRTVGYTKNLSKDHPNYLSAEYRNDLFLNLVDPPVPLFQAQSFALFRQFAREHYNRGENLLIHCNQGFSRAPSLAMLFLAKELGVISSESYAAAVEEFKPLYPAFAPGKGIEMFMQEHWGEL
jgi:protein-tyrosine phosphatase